MFCRIHLLGVEPDEFSYGSVLSACCALRAPIFCKQVYSLVMKKDFLSNGYVQTRIMDLFSKNCNFKEALRFFYDASSNNVACWDAIISLAVKSGERWVALNLFRGMCHASLMPDSYTFPSNLTACCVLKELHIGRGVHGWAIKCGATDVFVETAIVDLYAKFGCMSEAFRQSSQMQVHNVVSWTAIISGFVQEDDIIFALKLFKNMRAIGQEINSYTMTSVLSACAKPGMIKEAGKEIHGYAFQLGIGTDTVVGGALVNMYTKCGNLNLASTVFDMLPQKDVFACSSLVLGYAQKDLIEESFLLFHDMLD
ncbi:Pentatricopeptide repeat-containing protein, chloroplastic [Glycine soja]